MPKFRIYRKRCLYCQEFAVNYYGFALEAAHLGHSRLLHVRVYKSFRIGVFEKTDTGIIGYISRTTIFSYPEETVFIFPAMEYLSAPVGGSWGLGSCYIGAGPGAAAGFL